MAYRNQPSRHYLTGTELDGAEIKQLIARAIALKASPHSSKALKQKSAALIFDRPSTRTRVSFELAVVELGGHPILLRADELQLSRGESLRDTALVLSRHVDVIGVRTGSQANLEELADYSEIPVINLLTAEHHPVQALADLMTLHEAYGTLEGLKVTYIGDGNNVARSLALLGKEVGIEVTVSSPSGYRLEDSGGATLIDDPQEAVKGANAIYTDVWVSMGDDQTTAQQRRSDLQQHQLNDTLLDRAAQGAFALHCLPAHLGEEITESVLYGSRQRIWDQAENRRHTQKALLEQLV